MTILIADDDRLARYTLKSLLRDLDDWNFMVAEATNGKTLIEQCSKLQPDIAFVDIDMPHLDGLTAIATCKEISPYTQFVITSGYTEFCYAQKSIALQVKDYLVKPVERELLEPLLKRLTEQLEQIRSRVNMNFQVKAAQSFQLWEEIGYVSTEDPCQNRNGTYHSLTFFLDTRPQRETYAEYYFGLTKHLNALGRSCESRKIPWILWNSKNSYLHFVVLCEASEFEEIRKTVEAISREQKDFSISCLHFQAPDLWSIYEKMADSPQYEAFRFGFPAQKLIEPQTICLEDSEKELLCAAAELVNAFQDSNETQYEKCLQVFRNPVVFHNLVFIRLVSLLGLCLNGTFTASDLPHLYEQLKKHKSHLYTEAKLISSDKITYATDYMKKYYMQDISVVQIADKLGMTPNYFSRIFHESTGQTFSAYLAILRINQAKRILSTRLDIPVKDIALMVGYFSSRHFSKVFKTITGVSPSEFRDQSKGT